MNRANTAEMWATHRLATRGVFWDGRPKVMTEWTFVQSGRNLIVIESDSRKIPDRWIESKDKYSEPMAFCRVSPARGDMQYIHVAHRLFANQQALKYEGTI